MSTLNTTFEHMTRIHNQQEPLLVANVWDAHSAKIAQDAGFKLLATSSHAIAFTLGYKDGEDLPLEDLLFVVKKIMRVATVPVSVDFESGYSDDPLEVAKNVQKLVDLGVAGINLEDGKIVNGSRELTSDALLNAKIKAIKAQTTLFINARTDTYTTKHENALEESIRRATGYAQAGADGIFVPLIQTPEDILAFVSKIKLPLNVFTTKDLPSYQKLAELGVKRISHGAKQYEQLMKISKNVFEKFEKTKDFGIVLG